MKINERLPQVELASIPNKTGYFPLKTEVEGIHEIGMGFLLVFYTCLGETHTPSESFIQGTAGILNGGCKLVAFPTLVLTTSWSLTSRTFTLLTSPCYCRAKKLKI